MQQRLKPYDKMFGSFFNDIQVAIRREVFGDEIGQYGWLGTEEYRAFLDWMELTADCHVLDVACGSGGPTLFLARTVGCRVTGIDINEQGIAIAKQTATDAGLHARIHFQVADVTKPLPFEPATFDALLCTEAMVHFPDRLKVLQEWFRVLRPGARILYTDGGVITGVLSNTEAVTRCAHGSFMFVPPGLNETLIAKAGFHLVRCEDVTDNAARVSERWLASFQRHRDEIVEVDGEESLNRRQASHDFVRRQGNERRLSRMVYMAEKPNLQNMRRDG